VRKINKQFTTPTLIISDYEPFIKEKDVREIFRHCGTILEYIENRETKTARITFASKHLAETGLKKFKNILSHKRIKMPMTWERHEMPKFYLKHKEKIAKTPMPPSYPPPEKESKSEMIKRKLKGENVYQSMNIESKGGLKLEYKGMRSLVSYGGDSDE